MPSKLHIFAQRKKKAKGLASKQKPIQSTTLKAPNAAAVPHMAAEPQTSHKPIALPQAHIMPMRRAAQGFEDETDFYEQLWVEAAKAAACEDGCRLDATSWEMIAKPCPWQVEAANSSRDEDTYFDAQEDAGDGGRSEDEEVDMELVDSDDDDDDTICNQLADDDDLILDEIQLDLPTPLWLNPGLIIFPGADYLGWEQFENLSDEEIEGYSSKAKQSPPPRSLKSCLKSSSPKRRQHAGIQWALPSICTSIVHITKIGTRHVQVHRSDPWKKACKQRAFFSEHSRRNLNAGFPIDVPEDEELWEQLSETPCLHGSIKGLASPPRPSPEPKPLALPERPAQCAITFEEDEDEDEWLLTVASISQSSSQ